MSQCGLHLRIQFRSYSLNWMNITIIYSSVVWKMSETIILTELYFTVYLDRIIQKDYYFTEVWRIWDEGTSWNILNYFSLMNWVELLILKNVLNLESWVNFIAGFDILLTLVTLKTKLENFSGTALEILYSQ